MELAMRAVVILRQPVPRERAHERIVDQAVDFSVVKEKEIQSIPHKRSQERVEDQLVVIFDLPTKESDHGESARKQCQSAFADRLSVWQCF